MRNLKLLFLVICLGTRSKINTPLGENQACLYKTECNRYGPHEK
jgi:hypothetical protein